MLLFLFFRDILWKRKSESSEWRVGCIHQLKEQKCVYRPSYCRQLDRLRLLSLVCGISNTASGSGWIPKNHKQRHCIQSLYGRAMLSPSQAFFCISYIEQFSGPYRRWINLVFACCLTHDIWSAGSCPTLSACVGSLHSAHRNYGKFSARCPHLFNF